MVRRKNINIPELNHHHNNNELNNRLLKLITLYQDYTDNFLKFCVKVQLIQLLNKESIPTITKILNQTLEICLKSEEIKKYIIKVTTTQVKK